MCNFIKTIKRTAVIRKITQISFVASLMIAAFLTASALSSVQPGLMDFGLAYAKPAVDDDGWVTMPEGGRPAFAGVQGGTVPATVFTTPELEETTAQAGLTNNDFLQVVQGGASDMTASTELVPVGFIDHSQGTDNVASTEEVLNPARGLVKIYEQDQEMELDLIADELTRI